MAGFMEVLKSLKGVLSPESPGNIKKRTEGAISNMQRTKGAPRMGGGSPATDYSGVNVSLLKSAKKQKRIAPGNLNKGAKLYKSAKVGKDYPDYSTPARTYNNSDGPKSNAPRPDFKQNKKKDKLGRSKSVPHYATKMAKELMGGKKRY